MGPLPLKRASQRALENVYFKESYGQAQAMLKNALFAVWVLYNPGDS